MKNFQRKKQLFSMECFSLPPSGNYLDPFNIFSVLLPRGDHRYSPKIVIISKKVNFFREKLSSLATNKTVSYINPSFEGFTNARALCIIHTTLGRPKNTLVKQE